MFKKYFRKKTDLDNNYVCGVNISITKDGHIVTDLLWPDLDNFSKDQIYTLGIEYVSLLYDIINGNMKQSIYEALNTVKPETKNYQFANYVYNTINSLETSQINMSNEIVVKPKNVFKK